MCRSPESREKRETGGDGQGKEVGEEEMETVAKEVAAKVKQVHIDQFTALCKDLQKKQEREEEEGGDTSGPEVSAVVSDSLCVCGPLLVVNRVQGLSMYMYTYMYVHKSRKGKWGTQGRQLKKSRTALSGT